MITKVDYSRKSGRKPPVVFKASFRFGDEVARINRWEVKGRYDVSYVAISNYMRTAEELDVSFKQDDVSKSLTEPPIDYWYDSERKVQILPCIFMLGFDVKVEANTPMPLEQMLDVEALNKFVLTGERPIKPGK